jgi:hypothetical protein
LLQKLNQGSFNGLGGDLDGDKKCLKICEKILENYHLEE